jgi:hypothetical protein
MALDENNLLLDIMGVPKVWSSLFVWPTRFFEQRVCGLLGFLSLQINSRNEHCITFSLTPPTLVC